MSNTALIFLHGSGGTGSELYSYLESAPLMNRGYRPFTVIANELGCFIITPTSPKRNYMGTSVEMNVWFDRSPVWQSMGPDDPWEDEKGTDASTSLISEILSQGY